MALAEDARTTGPAGEFDLLRAHTGWWVLIAALLLMPLVANDFVLFQVFGWTFTLGLIALSLMFLAGYGGMVSLVQGTVAGVAGYGVAILGTSGVSAISLGWPWWAAVPVALAVATLFGALCGALAARTSGIYTIMITLAIASGFFYFVRQNYELFNGFNGFSQVAPPRLFGVDWRGPVAFYYLALGTAALGYLAVLYVSRSPFGLALQGVRDNERRMAALGFDVFTHRVAAWALAAFVAAVGGVLLTWQNSQVSPGTVDVARAIDVLIVAVIGGLGRPIGPFVGAFIFVVLSTFAMDALAAVGLAPERFRMLVGVGFLLIVFFSEDGVLGLWERWRARRDRDPLRDAP